LCPVQVELAECREKAALGWGRYKHNQQLEELRNLQEQLQAGLRIRIHFIRIRIQHFRLNTNPDPDPIRIQVFNDQKFKIKK
jgi:hypothetical protein